VTFRTAGHQTFYAAPARAVVWNYQYGMRLFHNNEQPLPNYVKISYSDYVRRVAYHEILHAFGATHVKHGLGEGIMSYEVLLSVFQPNDEDTVIGLTPAQLALVFGRQRPQ
jgi:hypothetical protein